MKRERTSCILDLEPRYANYTGARKPESLPRVEMSGSCL